MNEDKIKITQPRLDWSFWLFLTFSIVFIVMEYKAYADSDWFFVFYNAGFAIFEFLLMVFVGTKWKTYEVSAKEVK